MRVAAGAIQALARTTSARRAAVVALRDADTYAWLVHHLSNRQANEASFADVPPALRHVARFEQLLWLFSIGHLNHGLSRLDLGEASFLYELAGSFDPPGRVAELGRFRGGTTFLLAAAGAQVVSLDSSATVAQQHDSELRDVLARFNLEQQVELIHADALDYLPTGHFDLVFLDIPAGYDTARSITDNWLPTLKPQGRLVVRSVASNDAVYPSVHGIVAGLERLVAELDRNADLARCASPDNLAVYRLIERT